MGLLSSILDSFDRRGDGGHIRHPTGVHKGTRVSKDSEVGRQLHFVARIQEQTSEGLGWDCSIDGHKTTPVGKGTICVVCDETWGDVDG